MPCAWSREVLSSNGSTSQGSICGSTLALMDAGVPIKAPVAGISCGLVTEGDRCMTMVDIQGLEDFFGDMDFKVGGTHKGITAIQMDLKIDGLTPAIIKEALEKTHKARYYILDEVMLKAIPAPREELFQVRAQDADHQDRRGQDPRGDRLGRQGHPEDLRRVQLQDRCGRGRQRLYFGHRHRRLPAGPCSIVETIAKDPEIGAIYKGKVTRLMNFGAFVEIAPGKEGLVHISRLDVKRVEKVEDVVHVGDEVIVKVTGDRRSGSAESFAPQRPD